MSYLLVVRPEVDADLIEVEAWYEQQESGLGREFLRAARETIDSLSANPLITIHETTSGRSATDRS